MPAEAAPTILVVDDAKSMRESVSRVLIRRGFRCDAVNGGKEALEYLRAAPVDLLIVDLKMPHMDGLDLLRAAKLLRPDIEAIMVSGYGTIEKAVVAMKEGARDFLPKPFTQAALLRSVDKALRHRCVCPVAGRPAPRDRTMDRIVGNSACIRDVIRTARRAADSAATILIEGESGTGKELLAEQIHRLSERRDRPLIKVNCAALPETLLEAELFGHERGAFTGAHAQRKGRFELAADGTLFLDEVAQFSVSTQLKLLRVLQTGEFDRLGGSTTLQCDVRIIAATNEALDAAVAAGRFREDLYYRLNVIKIVVPPLRNRKEDIPPLVHHFLRKHALLNRRKVRGIAAQALDTLMQYRWPGNIRELENVIERAVVLVEGDVVSVRDLPEHIRHGVPRVDGVTIPIGTPMHEIEQKVIQETLRFTNGDKTAAASLLGIARRTIYRRLADAENGQCPVAE